MTHSTHLIRGLNILQPLHMLLFISNMKYFTGMTTKNILNSIYMTTDVFLIECLKVNLMFIKSVQCLLAEGNSIPNNQIRFSTLIQLEVNNFVNVI